MAEKKNLSIQLDEESLNFYRQAAEMTRGQLWDEIDRILEEYVAELGEEAQKCRRDEKKEDLLFRQEIVHDILERFRKEMRGW